MVSWEEEFLGVTRGREVSEGHSEEPGEGIYTFYMSGISRVSCGSITGLEECMARETGVLPEEVDKYYTGRRERLAITVGETECVTLLPCATSWCQTRG